MQEYQFKLDFNEAKFESLLGQISEDNPCGQDIRRHEIFIRLKDIRNQILNNNNLDDIWVKKNKATNSWFDIISLCETILSDYSKDLQVICYYIEAKVNLEGFTGLAESLYLFKLICDKFGDSVYPKWEVDNIGQGLVPFKWMEAHLLELIKNISFDSNKINSNMSSTVFSNSWGTYLHAIKASNTSLKIEFATALKKQDSNYIGSLSQALQSIVSNLVEIDAVYLSKFLDNGSSISFTESIDLCNQILDYLQQYANNHEIADEAMQEPIHETFNVKQITKPIISGEFSSVEEAYNLISQANAYLLKHDFHSPSPYLMRRALEWRKKSLYEVFVDLFSTTTNPQEIFTLLGLTHLDEKEFD